MATQGERVEALEKEIAELKETVAGLAQRTGHLEMLIGLIGEPQAALEPGTPRDEILKAFRQIEAIANHINVKLPA